MSFLYYRFREYYWNMSLSIRKLRCRLNNLTIQTGNLSRMEALDRSTRIVMPVPVDESRFKNTRLNWSRESACKNLNIDPKSILEIGTLAGDFADFLIQLFSPEITVLVDYFEASDYVFGVQRFTPQTHLDFVKQRFKAQPSVELLKGISCTVILNLSLFNLGLLIPQVSSHAPRQYHTPHHLLMDLQIQHRHRLVHQGSLS